MTLESRRPPVGPGPPETGGCSPAAETCEAHTQMPREGCCRLGSKQASCKAALQPSGRRMWTRLQAASGVASPPRLYGGGGTRPTCRETPFFKDPHGSMNRRNGVGLASALKCLKIRSKGRRQVLWACRPRQQRATMLPSLFQCTQHGGRGGGRVRATRSER